MKEVLQEILDFYMKPSFGATSKREMDIFMFQIMQKVGVIPVDPQIYDIVKTLKVTRAKARNLLYEVNIRRSNEKVLKDECKKLLTQKLIQPTSDKQICIETENPLIVDHIKSVLKEGKYISDGSFSPEIIKLSPDAYIFLYEQFCGEDKLRDVEKELKRLLPEEKSKVNMTIGKLFQTFLNAMIDGAAGITWNALLSILAK